MRTHGRKRTGNRASLGTQPKRRQAWRRCHAVLAAFSPTADHLRAQPVRRSLSQPAAPSRQPSLQDGLVAFTRSSRSSPIHPWKSPHQIRLALPQEGRAHRVCPYNGPGNYQLLIGKDFHFLCVRRNISGLSIPWQLTDRDFLRLCEKYENMPSCHGQAWSLL